MKTKNKTEALNEVQQTEDSDPESSCSDFFKPIGLRPDSIQNDRMDGVLLEWNFLYVLPFSLIIYLVFLFV